MSPDELVTNDLVIYQPIVGDPAKAGTIGKDTTGRIWFKSATGGPPIRADIWYIKRPPLVSGMRVRWPQRNKDKVFPVGTVTIVDKLVAVQWDGDAAFTQALNTNQIAQLVPIGTFDTAEVEEIVRVAEEKAAKEAEEARLKLQNALAEQVRKDKLKTTPVSVFDQPTGLAVQEMYYISTRELNKYPKADLWLKVRKQVEQLAGANRRDFPMPADPRARMVELLALLPLAPSELREAVYELPITIVLDNVLQEIQSISFQKDWIDLNNAAIEIRTRAGSLGACKTFPVTSNPLERIHELLGAIPAEGYTRLRVAVAALGATVPHDVLIELQNLAYWLDNEELYEAVKALGGRRAHTFGYRPDGAPALLLAALLKRIPAQVPYRWKLEIALNQLRIQQEAPKETPMPVEEKPSIVTRVTNTGKEVARDAGWRILATQLVRTASQSVAAGVRAKMKGNRAVQRQIIRMLESPYGEAGLGVLLSVGAIAFMPQSAKRDRISHEFAVGAATLLGNDTINTFLDPFRTFITDVVPQMMASLPEPEPMLATAVGEKVASATGAT